MTADPASASPLYVAAEPLLEIDNLRVERLDGRRQTIVSSFAMTLAPGETLGIVGESGSGKSMAARAITGLLPPSLLATGAVRYRGRDLLALSERQWRAVRGREIGLILQDPFTMLNPVLRCGRILEESLRRERRLPRSERRAEARRRLAEVGIHDESVADRYPFQLSGGMRQRVAIAAALACDPRVLIADEPSTALDVTTQREILALIKSIQRVRGMALILITHDLRVAFAMCDRISVLYAGSVVEAASSIEMEAEPLHPYSHGLLLCEPRADRRVRELVAIPGSVPTPDDVAGRCTFSPRCRWVSQVCHQGSPPLLRVEAEHLSACARLPQIRTEMLGLRLRAESEALGPPHRQRPDVLIDAREVYKIFQVGSRRVSAVEGVSVQIGSREGVGLVGESGSGKTTLSRMIIGLETPSAGEIVIGGVSLRTGKNVSRKDLRALRGTVQTVFQDPYSTLNPMRSVGSTLREAIIAHHPKVRHIKDEVGELLRLVGLPEAYARRKPSVLSGGERQRVAIARALAARPRILICDEPVSALDVSVQAQILNLFSSLREEREIGYLFITHDLSIVRQVSEYLYVMFNGRIVEHGPTEEILSRPGHEYTEKLLDSAPKSESGWLKPRPSEVK